MRRVLPLIALLVFSILGIQIPSANAQTREFVIGQTTLQLEDVTTNAAVYFTSMRLNRAQNVWNVEITVSNKSDRVFIGPVIVLVDGFNGTSGPHNADGISQGGSFFELSAQLDGNALAPGQRTSPRTLSLGFTPGGNPSLITRVYCGVPIFSAALAVTRTLDDAGKPLPTVAMEIIGPEGVGRKESDPDSGVASFGQGPGTHVVKFSRDGFLPVWRSRQLSLTNTEVIPNPRLTRRSSTLFQVSPLQPTVVSNANGGVQIQVPAGAVNENATIALTALNGQTLPALLPLGWSPLRAFWIESSVPLSQSLSAAIRPIATIGQSETAALVKWDETSLRWMTLQTVAGKGTNALVVTLPGVGSYAIVVGDTGELAPPAAAAGQPLAGSVVSEIDVNGFTAEGTVTPPSSPASVIPEMVTGTANVTLRHANRRLPSGYLLRGEVTETYLLSDGSLRLTPLYEQFIVGYQRPGDQDPFTLHATFPMRPVLLFGPEQLDSAMVRVDVLPEDVFDGQVLGTEGGQISSSGVRILAGTGELIGPSALRLRRLDATVFTNLIGADGVVVAAFDLTVDRSTLAESLSTQLSGVPTNALFVLARVLSDTGFYGLQPVERLQSDAAGNLLSLEPPTGERLPGLRGSGQFVLVRVNEPQGLISGVAKNGQGELQAGMPVRVTGLPWMTLTDAQGRFQLIAPTGEREIGVTDPRNGDTGFAAVQISDPTEVSNRDVETAPSGPRVAKISPSHESTRVPRVSSVVIEFNKAVNPGTVIGDAIQLSTIGGQPVNTALMLNLKNTVVTLSPATELEPNTEYRVQLASTIKGANGLPIEGQTEFTFRTTPLSTRDQAAQLIIYEPGATNVPLNVLEQIPAYEPGQDPSAIVVRGTAGTADPEVPVILVNESTGETTTILSRPDGGFVSVISGTEEDFVSATFINLNGTRVYVPVSRQEFDNGFVGLYRTGGILEAQSDGGPVQVYIQPESIPTKTKLKLQTLTSAQLLAVLGGVTPEAGTLAGPAINLDVQGPVPELPVQVRFPVDLTAAGFPTNEIPSATNVAAVVALVRNDNDIRTFQVLDQLLFTPQGEQQPITGGRQPIPQRANGDAEQIAAGFLDTSVGLIMPALGAAALPVQIGFNQVLVPLLFGPRPVVVKGKVSALPYDLAVGLQQAGVFNQIASLQTGQESVDLPFQLAQTMGFFDFGLAIGTAQSVVNVTYTAFHQQAIVNSQPLSGAFVTLTLAASSLSSQPGRLFPGMVYATSGSDGYFLTVAPAAGANYLVTASHPRFRGSQTQPVNPISLVPGQQGDLSLAGAVYKTFFFTVPAESETPPTFTIATVPVQPAVGQPAQLIVNASQPVVAPKIRVKIRSVGDVNLLTGQAETNVQYSLDNIVETTTGNNARWTGQLTADRPVLVKLQVNIEGQNFNQDAFIPYHVAFTGPKPVIPSGDIPSPDTNDVHGPLVVETQPAENGFVGEDGMVVIHFNKPIDKHVTNDLSGIVLSGAGEDITPIVRLTPGQRTLLIQYPGLPPDGTFRLTLSGQSIRDLAAQPLDQLPVTPDPDSFTMTFRTPPAAQVDIPGLADGRGAVISGNRLYALDHAPQNSHLNVYDISIPLQPVLLSRTRLIGQPRDLAVVPQYQFKRNIHAETEVSDLVAVVGGDMDALIDQGQGTTVSVRGQYLWVLKMGDGRNPEVLASPIVSYRVSSAVTKVRWAPPYLVYQEYGQDIQMLGFVKLQEMLIGFGSTAPQRLAFPTIQTRKPEHDGKDLNGDGDYVDPDEVLPLPDADPAEFYGKHHNLVLQGTTQKILDFSVARGGADVGITLRNGVMLDSGGSPNGPPLPPMYRTLMFGGIPMDVANPVDSMYLFDKNAFPRWVTLIPNLPINVGGLRTTIAAALVSLQPDADAKQKLAVINISFPLEPRLVNLIEIPESLLGGAIQSISYNEGSLEVAGSRNLLLLNPLELANTNTPPGQLHPSILGLIPNVGAGSRSVGATDFGVRAIADGARASIVQSPPTMVFVSFPTSPQLPVPENLASLNDEQRDALISEMRPTGNLAPAKVRSEPNLFIQSDLTPVPNRALHYYVLVTAPGSAGKQIELGLESLNPAGRPLSNPGAGFAPVRAASAATQDAIGQRPRESCGAEIRPLPAWRMSDDPQSPFYNRYLSRPFALVTEAVSSEELFHFRSEVDREIIFSGAGLRAFIEPSQATHPGAAPVIGPFAAKIDPRRKLIFPISSVNAYTINRDYIVGDNPPPTGGSSPLEDTYGTIQAHSGELRTADVDLALPSPRMPISIIRTIGNQDTYEGPFGVGWDFNYNQRLTVLDPLTFPEGLQMPLVVREDRDLSNIAGSQDVLFNDGQGKVFHFRWMGTNMPPEYVEDPLVQEFNYQNLVSDYYLPQHGLFDLLVKFKDGRFERLTPEGIRYRYAPTGRLETIIDAYPLNRHELQYDRNGWLVRIDDKSVSAPRYVEIGHYRRKDVDPDFVNGLDENTANSFHEGLICRLRDHTGRDVLFEYDDQGFLVKRLDVEVHGENGGFSGRSETIYSYANCRLVGISATANGTPWVSAVNETSDAGKPVAKSTTGNFGDVEMTIPVNNSAKTVGSQISSVRVGDSSSVARTFDKRGNLTSIAIEGPAASPAKQERVNNEHGQPTFIRHPEGNTETLVYDSQNPVFRSRANLRSVTTDPGPRGGVGHTQTFQYDPAYNQQSGEQVDANGFSVHYTLTPDKRSIQKIDYNGQGSVTISYNSKGQPIGTVNQDGVEQTTEYDSGTGFVLSETTGDITLTYSYDGSVASQLGRPASVKAPIGFPTTFIYNNRMQPVQIARGPLVTKTAYDEIGRAVFNSQDVGDGKQLIMHYGYDQKGFLTNTTVSGVEVDGTISSYSTGYTPDRRSRVETVTHPNGTVQVYEYDARGNVIKSTFGDYVEEFEYDLNNNLLSVKHGGDVVRTYSYDGLDRATTVVQKTGTQDYVRTRTFHRGGQLMSDLFTDPVFGPVRHLSYDSIDALGRHLTVTMHGTAISPQFSYAYGVRFSEVTAPRMVSRTVWDSAGNVTEYSNPNFRTVLHRDASGRVYQMDSMEEGATYSQFYELNDMDQRTSLRDLLGLKYEYQPRADGNFTRITNPRNNAAILEHTALGELQRKKRADGMEVQYRRDAQRQMVYEGDPDSGFKLDYDSSLRLKSKTLRNEAATAFADYDPRSMPMTITMPGGSETRKYDLQRRMTERKLTYQGRTLEEQYTYDALDRIRVVTYAMNGGSTHETRYDYDPAGPLVAAHFHEDGQDFTVAYGYYPDGGRRTITYPSGVVVTETRDVTGRLTGLSDTNGNIINAVSWQGNSQPKVVQLGSALEVVNQYDVRGRLTATRIERTADDSVTAHMRYQYDPANNIQARQFLHRGGKADVFGFDSGERVAQAKISVLLTNANGSGPELYARQYSYHAAGLDYLTTVALSGSSPRAPPFATNWTAHDEFLLPGIVDGFSRGQADPKGNVSSAQLWIRPESGDAAQPVAATFEHDGLGRMTRVTRADGVMIENQFQPGGLRFSSKVSQNGTVIRHSAYVYDDAARLLEEYDRTVTPPRVVARYYYGSGDAPVAADLRHPDDEQLHRYYFLSDGAMSVVAVADAAGQVVERVWYDTFGQPSIELRDTTAPVVNRIENGPGGSLVVVFSEPVQPTFVDPGVGTGLVPVSGNLDGVISLLNASNAPIAGNIVWENSIPSVEPLSALRFTPTQTATGAISLVINAGALMDEWGNSNSMRTVTLTNSGIPGTIYYQATPQANTAPVRIARSSVGSRVLFQGQYFDYESGLFYLRARFYDPFSGMFLQPDPLGYSGSVNHYAGMANNPVSLRDPSGLLPKGVTYEAFRSYLHGKGYNSHELGMLDHSYKKLTDLGLGGMEIAAHIRVMYREHRANRTWELGIRAFGDKAVARLARLDEFYQTKEEKVVVKTEEDGLARHEVNEEKTGEVFVGDVDGLYAKLNGQIASMSELQRFQNAVNSEVARLTSGYKDMAIQAGAEIKGHEIQKVYQHGFSLNIPQEYGSRHALSDGGYFGYHAIEMINKKMTKGIGEAFSITFDPNELKINEHVDVDAAVLEHESFYKNVMFNPQMRGKGFDLRLTLQRAVQMRRDKKVHEKLFPVPFYYKN